MLIIWNYIDGASIYWCIIQKDAVNDANYAIVTINLNCSTLNSWNIFKYKYLMNEIKIETLIILKSA